MLGKTNPKNQIGLFIKYLEDHHLTVEEKFEKIYMTKLSKNCTITDIATFLFHSMNKFLNRTWGISRDYEFFYVDIYNTRFYFYHGDLIEYPYELTRPVGRNIEDTLQI